MTKNKSYQEALRFLARGFPVYPAENASDANNQKERGTTHLRVAETMNAEGSHVPWFVRCRTRDEVICLYAPHEGELRRLEGKWGTTLPNSWATRRFDGRVYLLFGVDAEGPVFHSYQPLSGTKVEVILYCPLPDGAEYEWVPGFSPADIALATLPSKIIGKLPVKHATATPGSITSRIAQREEFDPVAHQKRHALSHRIY